MVILPVCDARGGLYTGAEARKAGQNFFADTLRYDHSLEQIDASGNVRLEQSKLILTRSTLKLRLDNNTGLLTDPRYRVLPTAE